MKKVMLIDGNSLAYRAFYALPDTMKTSTGLVSNAIYGFTTMLLKLLEEKPDYIAIAFDLKEPTFRHKEYKEYKATRDKAPPTLIEQLPYVREAAEAFSIPIFEKVGFEADDVIGTLAKQSADKGMNVEIVSGDLDPLQLVNKQIKVLTLRKGISDTVLYDEKAVKERYGLDPDQLIDFKALKGDASDNIPGVPGIGEKTATELLKEYKTLDNLLEHTGDIKKPKLKAKLTDEKDLALMSRRLATIVLDVPIEADLQEYKTDWDKAVAFFEKMEFDSLVKKYREQTAGFTRGSVVEKKREELSKFDFHCVDTPEKLKALIEKLQAVDTFAFDCETTSLNVFEAKIVGISFSVASGEAYYVPFAARDLGRPQGPPLHSIFASDKLKIGHNLKYDIEVLKNNGIEVAPPHFDTMVAAYLLDPISGGYGLKKTGAHYLGRHEMLKLNEIMEEEGCFADIPLDVATQYACTDAEVTFGLYEIFKEKLKEEGLSDLFYKVEMPLLPILIDLEMTGVYVDCGKLNDLAKTLKTQMNDLERNIFAIAGETFNLNSPKQLGYILFEKLKIPVLKRTKTGPSTDSSVLEELSEKFEIAQKLASYRQLSKLMSTYIEVLPTLINPKTGRIHASFNQTITSTGRLSSSNPNMQNIPIRGELGKLIRSAFVPQKAGSVIVAADYSQIELRILAHLSGDSRMKEAFEKDVDIHQAVADELGITRAAAKTVNFGVIYGLSDFGLAKQLKIKKTEAAKFIDDYFIKYAGVKAFIDKTIKEAKENGFVTTLLGRKRPLPDINSPNYGLRSFAERTAINTPVQGTAADMIKVAMININSKVKSQNSKLILQVHDELVFEVPQEAVENIKQIVKEGMEKALPLSIPVKITIGAGPSWAETA
ncbi:DNA polymerase I [Candidatus Saganbacteria bacterium]|nr:DNA polymerase I [Candidatus Saganbacteria bacterium]